MKAYKSFFQAVICCFGILLSSNIRISAQCPDTNAGTSTSIEVCMSATEFLVDLDDLLGAHDPGTFSETSSTSSGVALSTPTAVNFAGVAVGTYTFVFTTIVPAGCDTDGALITITVNSLPTANLESNAAFTCVDDDSFGGIDFTASGGTMYEFFIDADGDGMLSAGESIQANSTTNTISYNPTDFPGTGTLILHVVVTDANGCSAVASVEFDVFEFPDPGVLTEFEACTGDIDLDDLLTDDFPVTGGDWRIINTPTGVTITLDANNAANFPAGSYIINYEVQIVIGMDADGDPIYGCGTSFDHPFTVHPLPVPANDALEICDDDADGFAAFTLTDADIIVLNGQTGTVTYHASLADAQTGTAALTSAYTNITATTQTIHARVVSDAGCDATAEVSLTVNPLPVVTFHVSDFTCENECQLIAMMTDGILLPGTYSWTGPDGFTSDMPSIGGAGACLEAGTYTLEFTDANGCTGTGSIDHTPQQCLDLALIKELTTTGNVRPGNDVTFNVTVFNQGATDAYDVDVADYFPACLTLPLAAYASHTGAGTEPMVTDLGDGTYTISTIPAGEEVVVALTFTIDAACTDTEITNNAEITGGATAEGGLDAIDSDSTPGDDADSPPDPDDDDTDDETGGDDFDPATFTLCNSDCGEFPWDGNE